MENTTITDVQEAAKMLDEIRASSNKMFVEYRKLVAQMNVVLGMFKVLNSAIQQPDVGAIYVGWLDDWMQAGLEKIMEIEQGTMDESKET